jgi:pimeloyl-ACP methyl ester carboxylesterase
MHVERYGSGAEAFLCLHGWNGTHATFEPLAKGLPEGVSLWCPNIPARESLAAITSELETVARQIAGPLRIVGNCSGALHGLLLAEHLRVERIVMIDAFAWLPLYFRPFLAPVFGYVAYWSAFANPLGRWAANLSMARHRKGTTDLTAGFREVNHAETYRHLLLLAGLRSPERFRGVCEQVDIVYGQRSFQAVKKSAAIWKQVFPEAREYSLTGAGHLPILEAPRQLQGIICQEKPCRV